MVAPLRVVIPVPSNLERTRLCVVLHDGGLMLRFILRRRLLSNSSSQIFHGQGGEAPVSV